MAYFGPTSEMKFVVTRFNPIIKRNVIFIPPLMLGSLDNLYFIINVASRKYGLRKGSGE